MTVQVGQGSGAGQPTGVGQNITNALFYASGGGEVKPTKDGWHLLTFNNGDTAVVNYQNGEWQWGKVAVPAADVTSLSWLGYTTAQIAQNHKQWDQAETAVRANITNSADVISTLASEIDRGQLGLYGHAVLIGGNAKATGGTNTQKGGAGGGDAQGSNINPPNINLPSLTGGLEGDAIRVLEAVGAVLLLAIGLRALIAGDSPTSITMSAARKAAKVVK